MSRQKRSADGNNPPEGANRLPKRDKAKTIKKNPTLQDALKRIGEDLVALCAPYNDYEGDLQRLSVNTFISEKFRDDQKLLTLWCACARLFVVKYSEYSPASAEQCWNILEQYHDKLSVLPQDERLFENLSLLAYQATKFLNRGFNFDEALHLAGDPFEESTQNPDITHKDVGAKIPQDIEIEYSNPLLQKAIYNLELYYVQFISRSYDFMRDRGMFSDATLRLDDFGNVPSYLDLWARCARLFIGKYAQYSSESRDYCRLIFGVFDGRGESFIRDTRLVFIYGNCKDFLDGKLCLFSDIYDTPAQIIGDLTGRNEEGNLTKIIKGSREDLTSYLDAAEVPESERRALIKKFEVEIARVTRPKWIGRLERGGELATLNAPLFLKRVHADYIGDDGSVENETIRAIDPDLMNAVEIYLAQRRSYAKQKKQPLDLKDAKGLIFILSRPKAPRKTNAEDLNAK